MNTIILIKLIAAHLTGDFLLQSDKMCADKFSSHSTAKYNALVLHALIQAALTYVCVAQWNNWIIPVVIGVSHFAIDFVKTMSRRKDFISLIWDQAAHLCVIIGLSMKNRLTISSQTSMTGTNYYGRGLSIQYNGFAYDSNGS